MLRSTRIKYYCFEDEPARNEVPILQIVDYEQLNWLVTGNTQSTKFAHWITDRGSYQGAGAFLYRGRRGISPQNRENQHVII